MKKFKTEVGQVFLKIGLKINANYKVLGTKYQVRSTK